MARRNREIHPSVRRDSDQDNMEGYPAHGSVAPDDSGDTPDPDFAAERREARVDPLADIRRENEMLRREMGVLASRIPPAAPATSAPEPEEEPDWDQMLFADPKGALKLYGERVANQVKHELRTEYQQEQGTQRFWQDFYEANDDLVDDNDLVQATLTKHLPEIANLPVSQAMEMLADLTRKRIMKYSKRGGEPRRTRAIAEGASAPSGGAPASREPETNVKSLSGFIKARKAKRRGAAA